MDILFFIPRPWTQVSWTEVRRVWVAFPRVIQVAEVKLTGCCVGCQKPLLLIPGSACLRVGSSDQWPERHLGLVRHWNSWTPPRWCWLPNSETPGGGASGAVLKRPWGDSKACPALRITAWRYGLTVRKGPLTQRTWVPEQALPTSAVVSGSGPTFLHCFMPEIKWPWPVGPLHS